MTISPIVGAMMQQSVAAPASPETLPQDTTSALHGGPSIGEAPDAAPAPGTHAAPVSAAEQLHPTQAEIVHGGTLGDDILAGLNKHWNRFSRAMAAPAERSASLQGDQTAAAAAPSGGPAGDATRTWAPVEETGYDAHVDDMVSGLDPSDLAAQASRNRDIDQGSAMIFELSKGIQGVESSIKTLVTGQ
jgi:hypothetical protein